MPNQEAFSGNINAMEYMRWSKVHTRMRYELCGSGVPDASIDDLGPLSPFDSLTVQGTYGDPELIELLAERYQCSPSCVVPVPGASSGNFIALAIAARRGSNVLIEHPVYEPLIKSAQFLDLKIGSLIRNPRDDFALDYDAVENGLKRGASAVVVTNHHNPSGHRMSRAAVEQLANCCARYQAILVVDEAYLDGAHCALGEPLWTAANLASNVVAVNSLTKVYGLSGLRIGWVVANSTLAEEARRVMDLLSVNNAAPSSVLAIHALRRGSQLENRYRQFHADAMPVFREWLERENRIHGYPDYGALFTCVRLPEGVPADEFNDLLTRRFDTQVVPGTFFGLPNHIRISLAVPGDDLRTAFARISEALSIGFCEIAD